MPLQVEVKSYDELTRDELYVILQLRSEVFVVEQDCVYQDIDGKDHNALHVLGWVEGSLAAYTRCFPEGTYFKEASIGRVVVGEHHRKDGLGQQIMEASIDAITTRFNTQTIKLSAQTYLIKFYNRLGFTSTGTEYLEDGIPHIAMIRSAT